jgi:ferritin-like metal-binding protein YciE
MASAIEDQLVKYLTDAHAIEEQALAQLRSAPKIAGDPELARLFAEHEAETEEQERLVRERLAAHDAKPSKLKDTVMAAGGKGFVLFARSQPDTPGKLAAHAISYENLEAAAYELLCRVASRAGDTDTVEAAKTIRTQEFAMSDRLLGALDRAVDASLREKDADDLRDELKKYLSDAHALEAQAIQLLDKGQDLAGDDELREAYAAHLTESRAHQATVRERLEALGGSPTPLKDAGLRLGALNWGAFFAAQPDTPGKLAAFAFAFEHLELAGYEQLKRVAQRAGDGPTVAAAEQIIEEERAAATRIAANWNRAVDASLREVGVAA